MVTPSRPPVAIRVIRPYSTEEEFFEHDLRTMTRSTILLLGAQKKPEGVVLRFELCLRDGTVLVRGEGRVVGFLEQTPWGETGLAVKLARVDPRSKEFLERANERRGEYSQPSQRISVPPNVARISSVPPEPISRRMPPPLPRAAVASPLATDTVEDVESVSAAEIHVVGDSAVPPPLAASLSTPPPVVAEESVDEEAMLDSMRSRYRSLATDHVQSILAEGRKRREISSTAGS